MHCAFIKLYIMLRQTKRLNSPYTSIQEFNKIATREEAYPISESPELFTWKLNFQQMSKMDIPKPFLERHRIAHQHQLTETDIKQETKKEATPKSKFDCFLMKQKKLPFIDMNQKKSFKMSKFKEFMIKNEQTVYNNKHHSLIKMMSSVPLEKLREIYEDKKEGVSQMITQPTQKKNRQFIHPKQNNKLTRPLGDFLALVNATCASSRAKPVTAKEEDGKSRFSEFSIKEPVKQESKQQLDISDENIAQQQMPKSDNPFRIKRPSELKHIGQSDGNMQMIPSPNFESSQPASLTARLSQKFQDIGKPIKTEQSMDERKYFFNYNNYFRKNYGFSDQGLNSRLSKQTSNRVEAFALNLQKVIQQKN